MGSDQEGPGGGSCKYHTYYIYIYIMCMHVYIYIYTYMHTCFEDMISYVYACLCYEKSVCLCLCVSSDLHSSALRSSALNSPALHPVPAWPCYALLFGACQHILPEQTMPTALPHHTCQRSSAQRMST